MKRLWRIVLELDDRKPRPWSASIQREDHTLIGAEANESVHELFENQMVPIVLNDAYGGEVAQ